MEADEPTATVAETPRRQDDAGMYGMQQLRVMEQPKWNEARLDDLNTKVDTGFARMDQRFERVEQRLDRLMWSLLTAALAIIVALIGAPHL